LSKPLKLQEKGATERWRRRRPGTKAVDRSPAPPVPFKYDKGIKRAVEILQAAGVETFESCEGGPGHAYPEPTIAFHGHPAAGWNALEACLNHGLPVRYLRRTWVISDGIEPTGPRWEITFRERIY
jgi:hypothetical protein